MSTKACPKCDNISIVKSGIVKGKQRYYCKSCHYYFTVSKIGKKIDGYYVTKALQLYLEGLSLREIERIIGVSHTAISSWVKEYKIKRPSHTDFHPAYKVFNQTELLEFLKDKNQLKGAGLIITEFGDKFMLIIWERFRK
jgi:hypothetical protein